MSWPRLNHIRWFNQSFVHFIYLNMWTLSFEKKLAKIIIRLLYCVYNTLMSLIRIELAGVKRLRRKSSWWSNINLLILSFSLRIIVLIKRYILVIFSIIILAYLLWGTASCTIQVKSVIWRIINLLIKSNSALKF